MWYNYYKGWIDNMLNFRLYDKKLDIDLEEYRKSNDVTKSGKIYCK